MDEQKRQKAREKVARLWLDFLSLSEADFPRVLELISNYSHLEACRPFAAADLKRGVARSVIIDRYCLRDHEFRRLAVDAGVYKPKRF